MTLPGVQIGTGSAELAKGPRRAARARAATMSVLLAGTALKRWPGGPGLTSAPGVLPDVKVPPGADGSFVLVRDSTRLLSH
jgi:hypothetical protein